MERVNRGIRSEVMERAGTVNWVKTSLSKHLSGVNYVVDHVKD